MRTDPGDNGGLFVGRRPGTAPVRFRALPERGSELRQRFDGSLAGILLGAMILLCLLCWGPIPLACLWIGSQVDYLSGSVTFGILASFVGLFTFLFGALAILRRLDQAWILVRRAAGHDQRIGALGRIFAITAVVCAADLRLLVHRHPRPRRRISPAARKAPRGGREQRRLPAAAGYLGLLDYYRQFEGMSEEEVNVGLRAQAAERRRKALTRVETLDLSQTTWPELAHPRIVSAITFTAQRGMQRYPHLRGSQLHDELATRHGVDSGRLILGNGAAELLSSATRALISPGQRLITSWPSYPLYPIMARRAHGRAEPVTGGVDALLQAAGEDETRVIALASPNDPTGALLPTAELSRLLQGLPEGVAVLLDESLVEFADAQPTDSSLALLEQHPRLLVFRSFSKAWGLAGLRVGYALGGPGSEELLAELAPDLGVSEVSQAGALEALRRCSDLVAERVRLICEERVCADRRPARASLRGHRQPGQLPVGRPPHGRRWRVGRAPGARRRARGRRGRPRRVPPRAYRPARRRVRAPAKALDKVRSI